MSKPHIHAQSSARRHGGKMEDYLAIHELMDSSKSAIADNRHRVLTHTAWFIRTILPKVFGETITNSDGGVVSIYAIGEQHILEDFAGKFIPTVQDYLEEMTFRDWMNNGAGEMPASAKSIHKGRKSVTVFKEFSKD